MRTPPEPRSLWGGAMKGMMLVLGALLLSSAAQADTRSDVLSGIARCSAIADDHEWLNCLYGAAQPMRSQLGLPPAPPSQTALVPPTSPTSPRFAAAPPPASAPRDSGGFFSRLLGGQPVITNIRLNDYFSILRAFSWPRWPMAKSGSSKTSRWCIGEAQPRDMSSRSAKARWGASI